jgi:hypothetical protein
MLRVVPCVKSVRGTRYPISTWSVAVFETLNNVKVVKGLKRTFLIKIKPPKLLPAKSTKLGNLYRKRTVHFRCHDFRKKTLVPGFIAASIYDKYSVRLSIRPVCTRCCFTMTDMVQVCSYCRWSRVFIISTRPDAIKPGLEAWRPADRRRLLGGRHTAPRPAPECL